jgi:hypothetical protein
MKKVLKFFINLIGLLSGTFLLIIIILLWAIALMLTTITELVTWAELKLTNYMKKCYGKL